MKEWATDSYTKEFIRMLNDEILVNLESLRGCSDFSDYKRRDGVIEGIERVKNLIEEMKND